MKDKKSLRHSQAVNKELQKPLLPIPGELLGIFDTDSQSETEGTVHRKPSMSKKAASLLMPKKAARPAKELATSKRGACQRKQPKKAAKKPDVNSAIAALKKGKDF